MKEEKKMKVWVHCSPAGSGVYERDPNYPVTPAVEVAVPDRYREDLEEILGEGEPGTRMGDLSLPFPGPRPGERAGAWARADRVGTLARKLWACGKTGIGDVSELERELRKYRCAPRAYAEARRLAPIRISGEPADRDQEELAAYLRGEADGVPFGLARASAALEALTGVHFWSTSRFFFEVLRVARDMTLAEKAAKSL